MTNWMWFVSGVISGGLITGVASFFIFKKKKDEMERKYTDMVNEFFVTMMTTLKRIWMMR